MTGWRVGNLVASPDLAELLTGMQRPIVSCVNIPAQMAALTAVSGPQQQALGEQRSAVVLVGAQAIYLQTGDLALAPYATDGDVAIDPSRLRDNPKIAQALRGAGFFADTRHVGIWIMSRPLEGRAVEIKIDLMVPEAVGGPGRGAPLGPHGNEAARKSEDARRARVRA